jgi:hypothetical protein
MNDQFTTMLYNNRHLIIKTNRSKMMKLKKARKSKLLTTAKRQTPKLTEIKALNRKKGRVRVSSINKRRSTTMGKSPQLRTNQKKWKN